MPSLLIVSHQPSANTRRLTAAVVRGASSDQFSGIDIVVKKPLEAEANDVTEADAIILGSTENFGYMAGLMKDFLERIYYPCLEQTEAKSWTLFVRAGLDGQGAKTSIERIVTGLKWRAVQEPLLMVGEYQDAFVEQCEELGMTVAAGLEAGLF